MLEVENVLFLFFCGLDYNVVIFYFFFVIIVFFLILKCVVIYVKVLKDENNVKLVNSFCNIYIIVIWYSDCLIFVIIRSVIGCLNRMVVAWVIFGLFWG